MKNKWIFLIVLCGSLISCTKEKKTSPAPVKVSLESCQSDHFTCASVDSEDPQAAEAYQVGCEKKDYYACFRLGQLQELKQNKIDEALKSYERACAGRDFYGCRSENELRARLCYIEKKKAYCRAEPAGEERALAFLQTLDHRYQDAFVAHDFSSYFAMETTRRLYAQRLQEKNKVLLEALLYAKAHGKHGEASIKALNSDIETLQGKTK